ncbi:kinase [Hirsutella rhossiliensis]
MQPDWTVAEGQDHYIKTPGLLSYANEANLEELLRQEVKTCEFLRRHPHPNIAHYLGCLETRGRVSGLCFEKYTRTLANTVNPQHLNKAEFLRSGRLFVNDDMRQRLEGLKGAIDHLHSLGLVHNDITPANIMFNEDGKMVLVDFDSCRWLGEDLHGEGGPGTKRTHGWHDPKVTITSKKSDIDAFTELGTWLFGMSVEDFLFR